MTVQIPETAYRPDTVVLYATHFVDETVIAEYRKLRRDLGMGYDLRLLLNTTEHFRKQAVPDDITVEPFDITDYRRFSYPNKPSRISASNTDMHMLTFWKRHPHFAHYWFIEYDVRFTGNWARLFDAFRGSSADLLATTIYRCSNHSQWENWSTLTTPKRLSADQMLAAFMPIYRISNRALAALDRGYAEGWGGHFETSLPSILYDAGLLLEDMGGRGEFVTPGNEDRFYTNTPSGQGYAPGSMVFQPARGYAGDEPNRLWHPVKTIRGMATGRVNEGIRRAKIFLKYQFAR